MRDRAEDWEGDTPGIPEPAAGGRLEEIEPAPDGGGQASGENEEEPLEDVAQVDEELGRSRQLGSETRVDLAKDGDDFQQQENGDADRDHGDRCRIHHRRLHFFAESRRVFEIGGGASEDLREQTAAFAGADHRDVEAIEDLGMFGERFGKTITGFDPHTDVLDDILHHLVGGLVGQGLERLHH